MKVLKFGGTSVGSAQRMKDVAKLITDGEQVRKGVRWMPRLLQAMKDVISCDKSRGGANNL